MGRRLALAMVALAVAGLVLLVAFGMTWAVVDVEMVPGAVRQEDLAGRDLYPLAAVSGWIALAAVAGIVATRSWGRVLVAAVGLAAGAAGAVGAVAGATAPGRVGAAWLLAGLAAAVVIASCGLTMARGRSWPSMGGRYERRRPGGRRLSAWDAQDLGRDPTDDLVE